MVSAFVGLLRGLLRGNRGFIILATLGFAACFLLSELGRAQHFRWLTGWPPVLFVFTVPPEYRFRYTDKAWVRPVFSGMTIVTVTGLAIASAIERIIERGHLVAPPPLASDVAGLIPVIVIGGLLFAVLSLFSAWGLYSLFYRPDRPAPRGLRRPRK